MSNALCWKRSIPAIRCSEASSLRNKDKLLEMLEQAQQGQQQSQQAAAQIGQAKAQADIEKTQADAEKSHAEAVKTMSEAQFGELSFFRVYSGSVKFGSELYNTARRSTEKIGQKAKAAADFHGL